MKRPERVVAGGTRVDVQAYLGGSPRAMVRRTRQECATRHVSIYISGSCSCAIDADNMLRRGCAVLGLLECLQAIQVSVDLKVFCEFSDEDDSERPLLPVWSIDSRPLDLSVAGFAIAHPAFARNVGFTYYRHRNNFGVYGGHFPTMKDTPGYNTWLRNALGADPLDVVLEGPRARSGLIFTNPERWVEQNLTQILTAQPAN